MGLHTEFKDEVDWWVFEVVVTTESLVSAVNSIRFLVNCIVVKNTSTGPLLITFLKLFTVLIGVPFLMLKYIKLFFQLLYNSSLTVLFENVNIIQYLLSRCWIAGW